MQYSNGYDLESYCTNIKSTKVLERKKCAEGLYALLGDYQVLTTLNKGGKYPEWKDVINSIHCYLLKEAEKLSDDEKKKAKTGPNPNTDLLFLAVRSANKKVLRVSLDDLLKPILNIFTSPLLKKYYGNKYLQVLNECVLSESRYHGQISSEQWIEILDIVKSTNNFLDNTVLQCFKLVIKWGPLNKLPLYHLRNEFDFITTLCQKAEQSFSRSQRNELLEILVNFCKQNSSDCCLACCKLGENVFKILRQFYQPALTKNEIKNLLYEFFLLQVKLHHPKGVLEHDRMAYAFSWNEWRKQLASMYHIILEEMKYQLRCSLKNTFLSDDSKLSKDVFVPLCVEVFRQIFNSGLLNDSQANGENQVDGEPPPPKRYRLEISFQQVLATIQEYKSWQWLYIMTEYLKKYPYPIYVENIYELLEVISNTLSEKFDTETVKHCYECLDVLLDVEQHVGDIPDPDKFDRMWLIIWQSALRHVGLNHHVEPTHKLIQKLMIRKKNVIDVDEIFKIFFSGVVLPTPSSIRTLYTAANYYDMPDTMNNVSYRYTIIKWLLVYTGDRNDVPDAYLDDITSELLVKMCFKQWPRCLESNPGGECEYEAFENVYQYNAYKKLIVVQEKVVEDIPVKPILANKDVFNCLIGYFEQLAIQVTGASNNSSYLPGLVKRMSLAGDLFLKISKYEFGCKFEKCLAKMNIKEMFLMLCESVVMYNEDIENLPIFKKVFAKINDILAKEFDCQTSNMFRSLLSVRTLSTFFGIRNCECEDNDYVGDLKMLSVNILTNFCLHPNSEQLTDTQKHALESLIKYEYNFNNPTDCHMTFTFLRQVARCRSSIIGDDVLKDFFKLLTKLCEVRGRQYDMILEILDIFDGFIKHVCISKNTDLKSNYINLLSIFYNYKDECGYKVSLSLLKCIGHLIKFNIEDAWNLYEINWVLCLPNFLTSNYQEVRLEVIKYLILVFQMNGLDDSIFKMQKELFIAINLKSQEVFRIEANAVNQERSMDETVGRTSSVLHTYASLIISNSMWRKKFLYFLIRLVDDKKIDKDSLYRLLNLVALELKFPDVKTFLSFYSDYILREWNEVGKNFSEFPYDILRFPSELEFYEEHAKLIVPVLIIKGDENAIQKICELLKKSRAEVYELYFVEIMAIVLPHLTNNSTAAKNTFNDIMNLLSSDPVLGYFEHIDGIITCAAERVADKDKFIEQFDVPYKLLQEKEDYTVFCFKEIISLLEEKMKIEVPLLEHCALFYPNKLQKILLNLHLSIHERSTDEDKLKSLHQYATFVNLLLNTNTTDDIDFYIVRSVVYALLNFTCSGNDGIFTVASAVYLKKFCVEIARSKPHVLVDHLSVIVNRVIPLTSGDEALSRECLRLLRSIIVDNAHNFKEAIRNLDSFPLTEQLHDINRVYNKIRCEILTGDLENEIKHFLDAGKLECNIGSRANALKHLRTLLSKQKDELKELYEKSKNVKGYTKDSENSTLHNLICMLVKLCTSSDNTVSVEAARCLGEIGPLDLATLVLQPRKPHKSSASTPFELLIACVVDLFLTYLTDESAQVVRASSKALYDVLNSKEGKRHVATMDATENLKKSYLYPFIPHQEFKSNSVVQLVKEKVLKDVDDGAIWWPQNDHDSWIVQLTSRLLDSFVDESFLRKLTPICGIKVAFCDEFIPHLIHVVVDMKDRTYAEVMVKQINYFFENVWSVICADESLDNNKKISIQCMLNVIDFLRLNYRDTHQLQFDYLKIARTACYCSNYLAALLYVELWSKRTRTVKPGGESILENICENEDLEVSNAVQTILKESYSALGDLDALYGCNFSHIVDPDKRVEYFKQFDKWDQALMYYDTQVSSGHNDRKPELINSLKNCGLYHIATKYDNAERDYECMWRLGQFDGDNSKGNPIDLYEKHKYESLKCMRERHREQFSVSIGQARQIVIDIVKSLSLENTKTLYACLTRLQSIEELEEAASEVSENSDYKELTVKWQKQDKIDKIDFKSVEPVKAQRISILRSLIERGAVGLNETLVKSYLDLAGAARAEGYFTVAMRAIGNLRPIAQDSSEYDYWKTFEEAQIYWSMNEKTLARHLIKHLLKINDNDVRLKFASLKLYGTWMAETHSENPQAILNNYFLEPLKMMRTVTHSEEDKVNIHQAYDVIARFSDSEYQRILSYMKSDEFERKVKNMEKSKETADKIKLSKRMDRDEQKAATIYKKQSLIDEAEIENTRREKDVYFILAIKYYLLSLQYSDVNNIRAFRILSLWLENRTTKNLKELLDTILPKIPSHKFVSILPQLAPHLTNNNDEFGNHVMSIIERCCVDHPHHTLPIIMALANSNKDADYSQAPFKKESNEARVLGAQLLLNKLKKQSDLKHTIREMEVVYDALIEFAYTKPETCEKITKRKKRGEAEKHTFVVPTNLKLRTIKNFVSCLLPTCTLPIAKNYEDVISIHSYSNEFETVGGINCPKKIYCRGSDGIMRTQLLKGQDDLRQDAVMEQVFSNLNELLHANKHTRHLLIRTYKVIPLSKRSGVLEWVDSIRIGDYLVSAHAKYNPKDLTSDECKRAMNNFKSKSTDDKLKKFNEICEKFRPVFHKFFETNFPEPLVWYERRKAYMRSVATTSMCGYIVGLGDRHVHNILLDEATAEVIHIDFGIAFEQGKVLPTPETVPFRLTRDIEDAMGITGIEGVFRKSCEKTMEVMRKNSETIVTILEVLLYDPLYEWTISPAAAYSRQFSDTTDGSDANSSGNDDDEIPVNMTAERALIRLKQKLQGTEEGGTTSIEGQVERLLQQARDPSNLCRLFSGWQPYL